MSGVTWTKFFWSDWQSDPALRVCSYAARGLWMDMLCIAASHDPIGYVAVAGRALDSTSIARMTGGSESEVAFLLDELDRNGVFSRDRRGVIISRRMISDAKKAKTASDNGRKGGNPSLRKYEGNSASDNYEANPRVKPQDKGHLKPHKPEARSQESPVSNETAANGDDLAAFRDLPVATAGWRLSLRVLIELGGMEESKARTFLGSLKSAGVHADDFWEIAEPAWRTQTPDPKSYFKRAAENAIQRRSGRLGIIDPTERQQRVWCEDYRDKPFQWKTHERGPPPGEPGCRVSASIQRDFGFTPAEAAA